MSLHAYLHTHISANSDWKRLFCFTTSYEVNDTPFLVYLWVEMYICFPPQFKFCEHIKPEQYVGNAEGLHIIYACFPAGLRIIVAVLSTPTEWELWDEVWKTEMNRAVIYFFTCWYLASGCITLSVTFKARYSGGRRRLSHVPLLLPGSMQFKYGSANWICPCCIICYFSFSFSFSWDVLLKSNICRVFGFFAFVTAFGLN